jgi:hypothetical protein
MSLSANYPTRETRNFIDRKVIALRVPCGTEDIRIEVGVRVPTLTDAEMRLVKSFATRAATRAAKHAIAGIMSARSIPLDAA